MGNPRFTFPHPVEGTIALTAKGSSLLDTPRAEFARHAALFCINQSVLHVPRDLVTAFSFRDIHRPDRWGDAPFPDDIPLIQFDDTAAHDAKTRFPGYSSILVLSQLVHFYPHQNIHLYGFDYEDTPDVTGTPLDTRRLDQELAPLAQIWLPHDHRITNHGKLTTERLERYV